MPTRSYFSEFVAEYFPRFACLNFQTQIFERSTEFHNLAECREPFTTKKLSTLQAVVFYGSKVPTQIARVKFKLFSRNPKFR